MSSENDSNDVVYYFATVDEQFGERNIYTDIIFSCKLEDVEDLTFEICSNWRGDQDEDPEISCYTIPKEDFEVLRKYLTDHSDATGIE